MSDQQPAGWYPNPEQPGTQRYWDGASWSDHVAPVGGLPKKSGGKGWLIGVGACLALAIIAVIGGALAGGGDEDRVDTSDRTASSPSNPTTADADEPTTETTVPEIPEPTEPATTQPAPQPIVQSGQGDGQTAPLNVPPGNYTVSYKFDGECFYGGSLEPLDSSGFEYHDLGTGQGPIEGGTNLYDVQGGEYYVKMITGPAPGCAWTVTLTPQG